MKHTPGPWHWHGVTLYGASEPIIDIDNGFIFGIKEQADANRKLIAAAPELLEALQAAQSFLYDDSGTRIADKDTVLKVRAAIALAIE